MARRDRLRSLGGHRGDRRPRGAQRTFGADDAVASLSRARYRQGGGRRNLAARLWRVATDGPASELGGAAPDPWTSPVSLDDATASANNSRHRTDKASFVTASSVNLFTDAASQIELRRILAVGLAVCANLEVSNRSPRPREPVSSTALATFHGKAIFRARRPSPQSRSEISDAGSPATKIRRLNTQATAMSVGFNDNEETVK